MIHVLPINPLHSVGVHLGGGGLYSSQKDFLSVLRHLLQVKAGRAANPILSLASVDSIFEPTLPPAGAATLDPIAAFFFQYVGFPASAAQFSRGLFLTTADVPGKRKKHSGSCTCLPNLLETSFTPGLQGAVGQMNPSSWILQAE
jgi:hypothetical protein